MDTIIWFFLFQGWNFQPLNHGGRGPIYGKAFPLKVKIDLNLGFGLWPRFWPFQLGFTLDYFDFNLFDFDFDLEISWPCTKHWLGSRLELWLDVDLRVDFDVWLVSQCRPLTLTLTLTLTCEPWFGLWLEFWLSPDLLVIRVSFWAWLVNLLGLTCESLGLIISIKRVGPIN